MGQLAQVQVFPRTPREHWSTQSQQLEGTHHRKQEVLNEGACASFHTAANHAPRAREMCFNCGKHGKCVEPCASGRAHSYQICLGPHTNLERHREGQQQCQQMTNSGRVDARAHSGNLSLWGRWRGCGRCARCRCGWCSVQVGDGRASRKGVHWSLRGRERSNRLGHRSALTPREIRSREKDERVGGLRNTNRWVARTPWVLNLESRQQPREIDRVHAIQLHECEPLLPVCGCCSSQVESCFAGQRSLHTQGAWLQR